VFLKSGLTVPLDSLTIAKLVLLYPELAWSASVRHAYMCLVAQEVRPVLCHFLLYACNLNCFVQRMFKARFKDLDVETLQKLSEKKVIRNASKYFHTRTKSTVRASWMMWRTMLTNSSLW
jgi:hypothetical protein